MIDKRMMYAEGQRVAKTMDGSRPGYRGSDYGDQAYSRGAYSSPSTSSYNPGAGGVVDHSPQNTGSGSTDDRSSALQTYNTKKATGRLGRIDQEGGDLQYDKRGKLIDETGTRIDKTFRGGFTGPLNDREKIFQEFLNYRKPVKGYGLTRILGLDKGPMQAFSDFNASINRPFFEKVIRAGKIPGLNFGTASNMTFDQLEDAYQSYMTDRMSGKTDAYGNPLLGYGDKDNQGITSIYDPNMFVDETGEIGETGTDDVDIFTSRYLQNQPDKIRSDIEEQMQNYYTV